MRGIDLKLKIQLNLDGTMVTPEMQARAEAVNRKLKALFEEEWQRYAGHIIFDDDEPLSGWDDLRNAAIRDRDKAIRERDAARSDQEKWQQHICHDPSAPLDPSSPADLRRAADLLDALLGTDRARAAIALVRAEQ